jgi:hypothetical protein
MDGVELDGGGGRSRWIARPMLLAVLGAVAIALVLAARWSTLTSVVEVVAALGILVGVAVGMGVIDADRGRRRRDRRRAPPPSTAAAAVAGLDGLDRIEHRRIELGDPWPQVVVGPTGVVVVDVCDVAGPETVVVDGIVHDGRTGTPCAACQRLGPTLRRIEAALAPVPGAAPMPMSLPVRGVTLVDGPVYGDAGTAPADRVVIRPVQRLADELARGPVLPMATVDAAFARVARLVPSLWEPSAS